MKTWQLFVIIFIFSVSVYSQQPARWEGGLSLGFTRNSLHTSVGYRAFTKYEPLNGFTFSLPVRYNFNDWFALTSELSYIRKNYEYKRFGFYGGQYQKTTNGFIQIPVMAHFSFGGTKLRGFLNLGGYASYWTDSHIKGVTIGINWAGENPDSSKDKIIDYIIPYSYNEKRDFDNRRDRRILFGITGGIGMEYALNSKYKLFIEGRYFYETSDLQKDYMINRIPRYNDTFVIQIGCLFNLSSIF